jgi:hypothetical protein
MSSFKEHALKQSRDYERIASCYHEAGHCIIACLNLFKVDKVISVRIEDPLLNGNTELFAFDFVLIKDKSLLDIIYICELQMWYAGLVAEKIYYKEICGSDHFPMILKYGSNADFANASKIIQKFKLAKPGKDRYLFKKKIQENLHNVIMEYWEDIKLISHALYNKKKLYFNDIKSLLTRKSINKNIWKLKFKKIAIIHNDQSDYELTDSIIKDLLLKSSSVLLK